MGTANFYNHENGIYVLRETTYDYIKENWEEWSDESSIDDVTDEDVWREKYLQDEIMIETFFSDYLKYSLKKKGIDLRVDSITEAKAYSESGKLIAELTLKHGYYAGTQVIVNTDPEELFEHDYDLFYNQRTGCHQDEFVKSKLYELYTPHNKTLFKVLSECTDVYGMVGQLSNGETFYEKR